MVILGINVGHGASAALMVNGEIKFTFQEERFTKLKNYEGYPTLSIDSCLQFVKKNNLSIDVAAFSSKYYVGYMIKYPLQNFFSIEDFKKYYGEDYYDKKIAKKSTVSFFNKLKKIKKKKHKLKTVLDKYNDKFLEKNENLKNIFKKKLINQRKVKIKKIVFLDHHFCHANYAYHSINFEHSKLAVLTIDSWGDYYNQTLWFPDKNKILRNINKSSECDLARIYKFVTLILSMKPNEHEFKVMGLAPYAKKNYSQKVYEDVFKDLLKVKNCKIINKNRPNNLYQYLKKKLEIYRFDNIAGGLQMFLENLTSQLLKQINSKYKIKNFAISGGVSMNIKMNMFLHKQDFVNKLYVAPSGTDESLSIGACYAISNNKSKPMKNIYLGQKLDHSLEKIEKKIKNFLNLNPNYKLIKNTKNSYIAKLLSQGEIVAIAQGREEFGARALGNRSIIADPSKLSSVKQINEMIKNRDFWMPFALTILDKEKNKFIHNKKNIDCSFMTIGFDTIKKNLDLIKAGTHPYDNTVRPQFLKKEHNLNYYNLIDAFHKQTGIPALLNTSLNLHGFPISSLIEDVFHTFEKSGLKYLLIENRFLIKKP